LGHHRMMSRINVLCYNEAKMLPMFHKWYSERLPSAHFVVYDNQSTDGSPDIAKRLGMSVLQYDSDGVMSDAHLQQIKNNAFKQHRGWNIVVDMDEWLDVTERDLIQEYYRGTTLLTTHGYQVVNTNGASDYSQITTGFYDRAYDKLVAMNSLLVNEMNYIMGAHMARPEGLIRYSEKHYTLRHMHYMNVDDMVARYKHYESRRSDDNRKNNYGVHYTKTEAQIREQFAKAITIAKPLP
jgi:hypothetical protein